MYVLNPNIEFSQFQLFAMFFITILETLLAYIALLPVGALAFTLLEYAFSSNQK